MTGQTSVPANSGTPIENSILLVRGQRVILDAELAALYGTTTKRLNEAVGRNRSRFPEDFVFQLTNQELVKLKSHFATSSSAHGGRRTLPYAFTEHGAIMASNILRSDEAVRMSVFVVRAFVKLREMVSTNQKLASQLAQLEKRIDRHDGIIVDIVRTMQQLVAAPKEQKKERRIGFLSEE